MKKLILILLLFLCSETKAQINYCDSISYTTTSTINYPFIVTGVANIPGIVSWNWTVCNSTLCYSSSGVNASFGQVFLTDTLKVCYDVIIDINGMTYTCSKCDSLVYNPNSYQWELMSQPTSIEEVDIYSRKCLKMYDLLGREIFEIPIGTIYIKNGKKYITNGRKP